LFAAIFNLKMKEMVRQCGACGKKTGLFRCSKCKIVVYCGRECQIQDHSEHRKTRSRLVKFHANIDIEKEKLLSLPTDMFLPPNIFENHVGEFWGFTETRPFVRSLAAYGQEAS
jgi:hypothetical protein